MRKNWKSYLCHKKNPKGQGKMEASSYFQWKNVKWVSISLSGHDNCNQSLPDIEQLVWRKNSFFKVSLLNQSIKNHPWFKSTTTKCHSGRLVKFPQYHKIYNCTIKAHHFLGRSWFSLKQKKLFIKVSHFMGHDSF